MRYVYPLDPECPVARAYIEGLLDDPMTDAMGAPVDDIIAAFERRHRRSCLRCQEYGTANVVVE
jgi:hypothetical protein